jgi:putative SOS response-associated peptidase YedK
LGVAKSNQTLPGLSARAENFQPAAGLGIVQGSITDHVLKKIDCGAKRRRPMCGRFALTLSISELLELFGIDPAQTQDLDFSASYNIAPSQQVLGIRQSEDDTRILKAYRWGLIPSWAKDSSIGAKMINARAETVAEKPSFKAAFRSRRCLIPASAFYEWSQVDAQKLPYCIRRRDTVPIAMAGIWESWQGPQGPIRSCAILTTGANQILAPIHQRMPVILDAEEIERWLDPANSPTQLTPLLKPCAPELLEAFRVAPQVNNPRHNRPECLAPL